MLILRDPGLQTFWADHVCGKQSVWTLVWSIHSGSESRGMTLETLTKSPLENAGYSPKSLLKGGHNESSLWLKWFIISSLALAHDYSKVGIPQSAHSERHNSSLRVHVGMLVGSSMFSMAPRVLHVQHPFPARSKDSPANCDGPRGCLGNHVAQWVSASFLLKPLL